jgi:FkbM family methyltransferase
LSKGEKSKINLLIKSKKVLKNWYFLPLIYLGILKKNRVVLQTLEGMKIIMRGNKSNDIHVFSEIWLDNAYLKWGIDLYEDCNVIDIGSHIGLFALQIISKQQNSNLLCYEPNSENFQILKENIAINNLKQVKIFHKAVSSKNGEIELNINENDSSGHSIKKLSTKKEKIESISFERILEENNLHGCDLLKLDCEGAEYDILFSIPKDKLKKIKQICLEYHKFIDEPELYKKIIKLFEDNEFTVKIEDFEKNGFIFAKR